MNPLKLFAQQLLRADRQVFLHMIQKDVKVRRTALNTLEVDSEIFEALTSYEVGFHLIPLPKAIVEKIEKCEKTNYYQPYRAQAKGNQVAKGGKAKTRVRRASSTSCQNHFQGRDNVNTNPHGRRLCSDYNLNQCDKAARGAECPKGWHLCCRKGCFSPHPRQNTPNRRSLDKQIASLS